LIIIIIIIIESWIVRLDVKAFDFVLKKNLLSNNNKIIESWIVRLDVKAFDFVLKKNTQTELQRTEITE